MPNNQENILVTIIVASVFFVLIGMFLIILLFLFLRRQRKNQQEKEDMKNRFEQTILQTQIEIQDQTLGYIASEIHDNIVQIIYLSRLRITQLPENHTEKQREEIFDLLKSASDDLREISHSLKHNRFNQIGLIDSLDQLLLNIEKTGKFETTLHIDENFDPETLQNSVDIIIFRMIQEVINNILKHAEATQINIRLYNEASHLVIEIIDNGVGFDTAIIKSEKQGIGLQNIFDRAKLIDASVKINSTPSIGTTVSILINTNSQ